ncbi:MAG: hypothetical protein ACLR4E_08225 [Gemmiger formicilis]|uniref:hypothetical protein n=1 Tax=Gemmiger formicilis TaxID=745368 RepID=UPI003A25AEFF
MDLYEVEVWNKVDKFWDKYLVRAWSVADAKTMTRWRLNEETDEGADAYNIVTVNRVSED